MVSSSDIAQSSENKQTTKMNRESKPANLHLKFYPIELLRKRSTSSMWDSSFDPFQVFEVEHEACLHLQIRINKGENITKGSSFKDFVDTPDPYVLLRIPGCSNSSKRTSHVDNSVNPMWDETFDFYLEPTQEHILHVTLMDANYTLDETLGEDTFCVNALSLEQSVNHTFIFPGGSKVHATLMLEKNKDPDLRFSLALCQAEKNFLLTRRKYVLANMQNVLNEAPNTAQQVPIIGILGSGGGFRAMTCLSGVVKALHETGIMDIATYIAGLSGSSWYISTLYAHDLFPKVTHNQIQSELRKSVTTNWKWQLRNTPSYVASILAKYKLGQPVSFTDFFGHLLGDVLLQGKKQKKLTDMQKFLLQGLTPMPLFTCLHAKRDVSARSFSEWVEFSPYEIGIAKYGTFMKTEDFGSKFIVGKKIKCFTESPLHFLQGVWGSAFTILFKRLVMEGGKKDIVQIMRDAAKEKEDAMRDEINGGQSSDGSTTDSEAEQFVEGREDLDSEDSDSEEENDTVGNLSADRFQRRKSDTPNGTFTTKQSTVGAENKAQMQLTKSVDSLSIDDHKENGRSKENLQASQSDNDKFGERKAFSFDFKNLKKDTDRKISVESDPGGKTEYQDLVNSRLTRKGAIKGSSRAAQKQDNSKKFQESSKDPWATRRKTLRKSRAQKKATVWDGFKESIMTGTNLLNSRAGRAGEILNPFRGLSLKHSFPISPFATDPTEKEDELDAGFEFGKASRYEPLDNKAKKLFIVDSGLAFNSPFPLLLRPQRAVDIYLSFDFSQRPGDNVPPFKELLLAEKWAGQNKVPFPPIEKLVADFKDDKEVRECYIFKHPSDVFCPVILHFPLVNNNFKFFKAPGVPRTTEEEKQFADFPIFDDPNNPYSSMNFVYDEIQFDRLTKLCEFNTLYCIDTIKHEIEEIVKKKKQFHSSNLFGGIPDVVKRIKRLTSFRTQNTQSNLKLKVSEENEIALQNYVKECERQRQHSVSVGTPDSDYVDALEEFQSEHLLDDESPST